MASSTSCGQAAPNYPELLVIPPISGLHKQSLIILHGRGSNAEKFGLELLRTPIPDYDNLQTAFPDARLIFPTASKRRAQLYKRVPINQWFDNWSLQTPTEREELQLDGLRETSTYIHGLLRDQIAAVGARNVVLWGLSQGCAASLIALLLWEGEPLAAVVGMCGWLPLRKRMEDVVVAQDAVPDDDDPFTRADDDQCDVESAGTPEPSKLDKIVAYLREEVGVDAAAADRSESAQRIPVFIGHGKEDEKVPLQLAQEASALLKQLDFDVVYEEYDGLAHWYSGKMLQDIVKFVHSKLG